MKKDELSAEWYTKWFGSRYYDCLYSKRDGAEAESFLRKLMPAIEAKPGQRILDAPCGKGRHSHFLWKEGYRVTGLDLSPESISGSNKLSGDGLEFFVHDLRNLFRTNYYDIALNLFTSLGYTGSHHDNERMIKTLATSLKPGGKLVIDFFNTTKILQNLVAGEKVEKNGMTFNITRKFEHGMIIKSIGVAEGLNQHRFEERVMALSLDDFKKYLDATGLILLNLWGDYELNPFDEMHSGRMILHTKKPL